LKHRFAIASILAIVGVSSASINLAHACFDRDVGSNFATAHSWVAGAQVGYNWQRGSWVYGVETDIAATKLHSDMQGELIQLDGNCLGPATGTTTGTVNWYGTARARVGWTSGQFLFYGTGGLAYGEVDLRSAVDFFGQSFGLQTSSIRAGWAAGGGVEYEFRPNMLLTLGYQYVDLGTVSVTGAGSVVPINFVLSQSASSHASFQVVTVGLNFRFGSTANKANDSIVSRMPVAASRYQAPSNPSRYQAPSNPWQGLYLGGHAGGAWGNSTNAIYSVTPP
jgi:outer membrane immunogenic protein